MILGELLDVLESGEAVAIYDANDTLILFDTVDNIGNDYDGCVVEEVWATNGDNERATININIENNL